MNTLIGISSLVITLLTIDYIVQHPQDIKWLKSKLLAFRGYMNNPDNGAPWWLVGLLLWSTGGMLAHRWGYL